jgi:putative addiction module component (TIGR02574 family)
MSIDLSSLKDLSTSDKLRIVTELWNDIATSQEPLVIPDEILRESSRRSSELTADPSIAIDEKELWRRVDG